MSEQQFSRRIFLQTAVAIGTGLVLPITNSAAAADHSEVQRPEAGVALSDSLFYKSESEIERRLDMVQGLGATAFRVDFDGVVSQPHRLGDYDFEQSDKIVAAAKKTGLTILATVAFTPPQDRDPRVANIYTGRPKNPTAFAKFGGAVAGRYGDYVSRYEIWNEPNSSPGVKVGNQVLPGADPVGYAALANATIAEIRQHQPNATISLGGLGPVQTEPSQGTMSPVDFLAASYEAGIKDFDAISIHPYCMPTLPNEAKPWNYFDEIEGALGLNMKQTIYSVNAEHGHADMEVWITEMGAPTAGTGKESTWTSVPPDWGSVPNSYVSPQIQALTVTQGFAFAFHKAKVTDRYYYTLMDEADPSHRPVNAENHYGLYTANGQPKPAVAAYRAAAKKFLTTA